MTDSDDNLFSIDDIMHGLPAKRSGLNLFAIESRTAQLAEQSYITPAPQITRMSDSERSQLFIDTLARDRGHSVQVTIQQLERFAPRWASLLPESIDLRAEMAHLMSKEYRFTYDEIPQIRQVFGLDTAEMKAAFQDLLHHPIEEIYVKEDTLLERFRWMQSRFGWYIEDLPPFWTAFSLNFMGTVGAALLALPIALAAIGPIAAVVVLVILGLVNVLTIAAFIEAIVRNGNMRYGSAFMGQLVKDYLGDAGSVVLSVALLLLVILLLTAYYIGLSTTLGESVGLSPAIWSAILFVLVLFFLRRKSLNMTIASAMVVAVINFIVLVVIMVLALPFIKPENITYMRVPFINNVPFEVGILELIFGVVLTSFFEHAAAANAAKITLSRDPSGKSLLWGNVWALIAAIVLYSFWVVIVAGAVGAEELAATASTALSPLAELVGPYVTIMGVIYVVLGMGVNAILYSLSLFNQMREWLPRPNEAHGTAKSPNFLQRLMDNPTTAFWVAFTPIILHFALIEWMLITNRHSFTGLMAFMGIITVPLLGGIFPVLLFIASRRKGDYLPAFFVNIMENPIVQAVIYLLFFASIAVYGLFIWQDPIQKILTILTAIGVVFISFLVIRRGAFTPRDVLEIRVDETDNGRAIFKLMSSGVPHPVHVTCDYGDARHTHTESDIVEGIIPNFPQLEHMNIQLPETPAQELKIWTHRVTMEGISESLSVHVEMDHHEYTDPIPMHELEGIFILPIGDIGHLIELRFEH